MPATADLRPLQDRWANSRGRWRRSAELVLAAILVVQFHELDRGRLVQFHAEARGELPERVIDVRQMIDRHVAHEGAVDFVVSRATMQPAQKNSELSDDCGRYDEPVGIHGSANVNLDVRQRGLPFA